MRGPGRQGAGGDHRGPDLAQEAGLLAAARRGGMRLAGPASAGVAVPEIRLAATPAAHHPAPGHVGLAVQSGGVGAALLEQFWRLGIGISVRCLAQLLSSLLGWP